MNRSRDLDSSIISRISADEPRADSQDANYKRTSIGDSEAPRSSARAALGAVGRSVFFAHRSPPFPGQKPVSRGTVSSFGELQINVDCGEEE